IKCQFFSYLEEEFQIIDCAIQDPLFRSVFVRRPMIILLCVFIFLSFAKFLSLADYIYATLCIQRRNTNFCKIEMIRTVIITSFGMGFIRNYTSHFAGLFT